MTPGSTCLVPYGNLNAGQRKAVLGLDVEPWQREACGTVESALYLLMDRPASAQVAWAVLREERPVGFLMLMRAPLTPAWVGPTAALMHSFQIDRRFQRQGLGTACLRALPAATQALWPDIKELVLSVDPGNTAALHLYQAQGWTDDGTAYRAKVGYERKYVLSLVKGGYGRGQGQAGSSTVSLASSSKPG
ncbi:MULTISPECIES: GNAT family N-acetyltransferase [Pseudomonas]|uniref:GNAT family N-acetyltransferase n=1 Tax=Pseudomonas quercus TaxID=2722792 RepID=A0ABX0YEL6_9PSED|nr:MULTISPECIES: GNAT family N-acetyltransferase [Pseudomonas]MBF7143197.1 GNAT family N-acetyltransferase [Pseudomonas sp. LY10J]NJP01775.1 GNAT family N-acetyltransferase [Pseudomonas quercus]